MNDIEQDQEGHGQKLFAHMTQQSMSRNNTEHRLHEIKGMSEREHYVMMIAVSRRRFGVSLIFIIPILALSPLIQQFLGLAGLFSFSRDSYILRLFTFIEVNLSSMKLLMN